MGAILDAVVRESAVRSLFFLSAERRRAVERWLRGRVEARNLDRADTALVSFGKSGRTWLRVMLSRFYQTAYGMPEGSMLEFDNFHRRDPAIPAVFWTHGNYLRDYTGHFDSKSDFRDTKVVLLARDPRDVAVSQYYQWRHRMLPAKKFLNAYPDDGANISLEDFVLRHPSGLETILEWFNLWGEEMRHHPDLLLVRYEDLREDTPRELGRVLAFMGTPGEPEQVKEAVEFASIENMREQERRGTFSGHGRRMRPGDPDDPNSFKVRKASVGGYRGEFDDATLAEIDTRVEASLDPVYGYTRPPS